MPFVICPPVPYQSPAHNPCRIPTGQVPISVTSYDPFGAEEGLQCMNPCDLTATGVSIYEPNVAACPIEWTRYGNTTKVDLGQLGVWNCYDNFGDPQYQAGLFWHYGYKVWVHPMDLAIDLDFGPPVHQLVWDWQATFPSTE